MRKLMTGLMIAGAPFALAACNKPAEEAAPVVTEEVPVETPAAEGAVTDDATADDAMADEKGTGDESGASDERGTSDKR